MLHATTNLLESIKVTNFHGHSSNSCAKVLIENELKQSKFESQSGHRQYTLLILFLHR